MEPWPLLGVARMAPHSHLPMWVGIRSDMIQGFKRLTLVATLAAGVA